MVIFNDRSWERLYTYMSVYMYLWQLPNWSCHVVLKEVDLNDSCAFYEETNVAPIQIHGKVDTRRTPRDRKKTIKLKMLQARF
jgi:hypothetical protein